MGKALVAGIMVVGIGVGGAAGEAVYRVDFPNSTRADVNAAEQNFTQARGDYYGTMANNECGQIALRGFSALHTEEHPLGEDQIQNALARQCGDTTGNTKTSSVVFSKLVTMKEAADDADSARANLTSPSTARHALDVGLGVVMGGALGALTGGIVDVRRRNSLAQKNLASVRVPTWADDDGN